MNRTWIKYVEYRWEESRLKINDSRIWWNETGKLGPMCSDAVLKFLVGPMLLSKTVTVPTREGVTLRNAGITFTIEQGRVCNKLRLGKYCPSDSYQLRETDGARLTELYWQWNMPEVRLSVTANSFSIPIFFFDRILLSFSSLTTRHFNSNRPLSSGALYLRHCFILDRYLCTRSCASESNAHPPAVTHEHLL